MLKKSLFGMVAILMVAGFSSARAANMQDPGTGSGNSTESSSASATSIQQLLAQLKSLQDQLAAMRSVGQVNNTNPVSGPTPSSPGTLCRTFDINLKFGDAGAEVGTLQDSLQQQGFAIGASERNSDSFGEDTAAAVVGFQQKNNLPSTGFFGPLSRKKMGCGFLSDPVPAPVTDPTTTPVGLLPFPYQLSFPIKISNVVQYSANNTEAFISTSIAPGSYNSKVASWDLSIGCDAGLISVINTYKDISVCNYKHTYKSSDYSDISQGILLLTQKIQNISSNPASIHYSLTGKDSSGKKVGSDSTAVLVSGSSVSAASTPKISYVQSPAEDQNVIHPNERVTVTGENLDSDVAYVRITGPSGKDVNRFPTYNIHPTQIDFTLPDYGWKTGTYNLWVEKGAVVSNVIQVQIVVPIPAVPTTTIVQTQAPTISYVEPSKIIVGGTIKVYGSNFDSATFIGIDGAYGLAVQPSAITVISPNTLSFVMPSISLGLHTIGAAEKAGPWSLSSPILFTVVLPPPVSPPPAPSTCNASLSFDKASIMAGGSVTATWNVQGASSATGECTNLPLQAITNGQLQTYTFSNVQQGMSCVIKGFINGQQACSATAGVTVAQPAPTPAPTSTPSSVVVLSPKGGETWSVNSTVSIKWVPFNTAGTVNLIFKDGYGTVIFAQNIPDNGSYAWTIPGNYLGTGFKIVVQPTGNSAAAGTSTGTFSVISEQTASALNALGALLQQLLALLKK